MEGKEIFLNKKVLIFGIGISGIAAAKLLNGVCDIILYDSNKNANITDSILKDFSGTVILNELKDEDIASVDFAVLSPGVPTDLEEVYRLRSAGVKILGEVELAYLFERGQVVAITGTNGKTTTTALTGQIMKTYYQDVFVVGNIGIPYTQMVSQTEETSVTVAEISSFQLETVHRFRPAVSAILNITPDHLNRHHTMECYVMTKERIAGSQTSDEVCVLNYEDAYTREFGKRCPAKVIYFSSAHKLEEGIYLEGEEIVLRADGEKKKLMNIHEMNLLGLCNVENVMAAIAISIAMEVPMDVILKTVRGFKAVEHRIEFVATKNGVDFYNDSKGTNPDAAIWGIRAMNKPTVLIGGGYDKQSEYDQWIEAFDGKVKALVLIGQTREKIAKCAKEHGVSNVILADTFEEAFDICVKQSRPGDAVLLSPACASWGMFPNYEVRGKMFKELVEKIGV